jgi:hypothetical protein
MQTGSPVLFFVLMLVLFAPLAYTTNFLFAELARRWGTMRFIMALAAYSFVTFFLYVLLFAKFRTAGLVAIYLLILAQTGYGIYRFRDEFRETVRNTLSGFSRKK